MRTQLFTPPPGVLRMRDDEQTPPPDSRREDVVLITNEIFKLVIQNIIIITGASSSVERYLLKTTRIVLRLRNIRRGSRTLIVRAPGTASVSILRFLFSKKSFDAVFAQVIADMREEHAEALFAGERLKARWVIIRGHVALGLTVAAYVTVNIGKKIKGIWQIIA